MAKQSNLVVVLPLFTLLACISPADTTELPCPCAVGFHCCPAEDRCVPEGTSCLAAPDAADGTNRSDAGPMMTDAGDASAPAPDASAAAPDASEPAIGTGLRGDYYAGIDLQDWRASRLDPVIDVGYGVWNAGPIAGITSIEFSVRWSGWVVPERTEAYAISAVSDDGVRVKIDGTEILSDWSQHSEREAGGTVNLVAGQRHEIVVEYYNVAGGSSIHLYWSSPGTPRAIIPTRALFPASGAPVSDAGVTQSDAGVASNDAGAGPLDAEGAEAGAADAGPVQFDYHVAPTGNDMNPGSAAAPFRTIGKAALVAGAGDAVFVANGVYPEVVRFDRSGTSNARIRFVGETRDGVIVDGENRRSEGITGNGQYVHVQSFTVRNVWNANRQTAALRFNTGWILEDVVSEDNSNSGIGGGGPGLQDVTCMNCVSRNNFHQGFGVSDLRDGRFIGGETSGNNRGCRQGECAWWRATSGDNIVNRSGVCYSAPGWEGGGGKWYRTNNVLIDGMKSFGNHGPGIWFDYQNADIIVRNTEVYGNLGVGAGWEGAGIVTEINPGPFEISRNHAHDNEGGGIEIWESMRVQVLDNRLVNDGLGFRNMRSRSPYYIYDITITGNTFVGSGMGFSIDISESSFRNGSYPAGSCSFTQAPGPYPTGCELRRCVRNNAGIAWEGC